ncbi:hypothetical protein M2480_000992 [Parabacteroides sp. PFB2-12]|nr:hypothetical protein [Parabacteroides sp. PM6-13]MDH6390026.1 hypothetical protein [Parabacteroides sp. PFB2-12]
MSSVRTKEENQYLQALSPYILSYYLSFFQNSTYCIVMIPRVAQAFSLLTRGLSLRPSGTQPFGLVTFSLINKVKHSVIYVTCANISYLLFPISFPSSPIRKSAHLLNLFRFDYIVKNTHSPDEPALFWIWLFLVDMDF